MLVRFFQFVRRGSAAFSASFVGSERPAPLCRKQQCGGRRVVSSPWSARKNACGTAQRGDLKKCGQVLTRGRSRQKLRGWPAEWSDWPTLNWA